jgi:mannose-6-phosphate isomerase
MIDYPIKFEPILKERIWGGEKLITTFNKESDKANIGESWEISDVKGDISIVSNGGLKGKSLKELIEIYKGGLVGEKVYKEFGNDFPILIKFIDAKTPLSIQVHPNNELAKERHNSFGKNEMWYVMQADDNNSEKIDKGDAFYIPTGRIHAIGAGVLLAEIQQTSDVTYRIYDYNRVDATTGKERELHTDLALDAIDYKLYDRYKTSYKLEENTSNELVYSPYFNTNIINLKGELTKDYANLDSFVIYMCVEGSIVLELNKEISTLNCGETILLPAAINNIKIKSENAKILEVYY